MSNFEIYRFVSLIENLIEIALSSSLQMFELFQNAENKNELLGKWARKSVQQISGLRDRWDNFEVLLNEHETLISQQVFTLIHASP